MKILRSFRDYRSKQKLVLTIGNFDGVHLGHQKILKQVVRDAKKLKAKSAVLTFKVHPRKVIYRDKNLRLLNFLSHKVFNLACMKLDYCFLVPFNQRIRNLSKEAFLKKYFSCKKIAKVIVGYDFHFGKNRSGSIEDIREHCKREGILFSKVNAACYKKKTISSGRVRELVKAGKLKEAKGCLGKPYSVIGQVVKGSGIGRRMGIRTANVYVSNEIFPPPGVYAVDVKVLQKKEADSFVQSKRKAFFGLAYRGPIPKFNPRKNESILEVFLYRFKGNLYKKYLEVSFKQFVRKPKKVKDLKALEQLIRKDIQKFK